MESFHKTDEEFLTIANGSQDNSGASVVVVLILDNTVYVATTGDVKAHLSLAHGSKKVQLNQPHILENQRERERVVQAGGTVEKTQEGRMYLSPGGLTLT